MNNDKEQAKEYFNQKSINRRSLKSKLIHLPISPPQFHATQVWRNPERCSNFVNTAWTPKDVNPVWKDYSVDCNPESEDEQ